MTTTTKLLNKGKLKFVYAIVFAQHTLLKPWSYMPHHVSFRVCGSKSMSLFWLISNQMAFTLDNGQSSVLGRWCLQVLGFLMTSGT